MQTCEEWRYRSKHSRRWKVNGQPYTPAASFPKAGQRYPLDRRLGGPLNRSGRCDREKNSCPCRISNPRPPPRNLVTTVTAITAPTLQGLSVGICSGASYRSPLSVLYTIIVEKSHWSSTGNDLLRVLIPYFLPFIPFESLFPSVLSQLFLSDHCQHRTKKDPAELHTLVRYCTVFATHNRITFNTCLMVTSLPKLNILPPSDGATNQA